MSRITTIDHIVLNVADVEVSLRFYAEVLGLEPERLDAFHRGEAPFPSVRVNDGFIIDLFPTGDSSESDGNWVENMDHFCLVVDIETFDEWQNQLKAHGVDIHIGPVQRWGARGMGTSIYFRDPDGNTIELRAYES
jgi:catechol 2,3-dioxygenase-like lactoylglutathione lyase family enzyme